MKDTLLKILLLGVTGVFLAWGTSKAVDATGTLRLAEVSPDYAVARIAEAVGAVFAGILVGFVAVRGTPAIRGAKGVGSAAIVLSLLLVPQMWEFILTDSCLDQGGRWMPNLFKCDSAPR